VRAQEPAVDGDETSTVASVLTDLGEWFVGAPLNIVVVVILVLLLRRVTQRAVTRTLTRAVSHASVRDPRAEARATTISTVLTSSLNVAVLSIGGLLVLGELGVNLAPLIAGAGIVGVALGFGAQSLVKDCITGLFMLVEDQYGVGDIVDVGEASGVVEQVTLRVTRLRSVDGTVWHIPNGVITRVGNKSQLWSMALLDVDVAYGADPTAAGEVILDAARRTCEHEQFAPQVLEEPQLLGVEALQADGVTLRLRVKTLPGEQWALMRALRAEIKRSLDVAGIEIPFPQRTVWLRRDPPS
jgi:small conductance mechanosensitive channel